MKVRNWTAALAVIGILTAGCGGDSETPTQAGQSAPTTREVLSENPPPPAPTTAAPITTVLASPYSSEPTKAKDSEGWMYLFKPSWGAGVQLAFSKDTATSPPGKARFVVKGTVAPGWPGQLVGDTPGRTPPNREPVAFVFYPISNYDRSFDFTGSQVGETPPPGLSCERSVLNRLDSGSPRGMRCDEVRGKDVAGNVFRNNPTGANSGSENDDEARVDAYIKALAGVQPIYGVTIGNICTVYYHPDGRRTFSNGSCS